MVYESKFLEEHESNWSESEKNCESYMNEKDKFDSKYLKKNKYQASSPKEVLFDSSKISFFGEDSINQVI